MHGGIGRSINHVEQIENLERPITVEAGSIVLMDLLWSEDLLIFLPSFTWFNVLYIFRYLAIAYIQII